MCEAQIRRPSFDRSFRMLVTLLMATEAVEIVLRHQLRASFEINRRNQVRVEVDEGHLEIRHRREVIDQRVAFMIVDMEGRHPHLEPRTDRRGTLQEAEQPLGLNLRALAIEDRRREVNLIGWIEAANVAAAILDDVA